MVLAGGTGGAALADGIRISAPGDDLTVIANTADDDEFWGLLVSPDVDAVVYRLAGMFNRETGYGVRNDTFNVLDAMSRSGQISWFRVGDQDLATHLLRTQTLREGRSLTEATLELCARLGVKARVLPMTDDPVRTRFATDIGELSFQEYYVRERLRPRLLGLRFQGIKSARQTSQVSSALDAADVVIIGPSNPLISIDPILHLVRDALKRDRTVAITPIVAGAALKGPTVEMMRSLGVSADPVEVARRYRDVAGTFVLDSLDRALAPAIDALGYRTLVCDTVMRDGGAEFARELLAALRDV